MRLINVQTLQLVECLPISQPPYAILSHTWSDEELLFRDLVTSSPHREERAGWQKVVAACKLASRDGLRYLWIDTCCIDRSSSSELSEAINSMYSWYKEAAVCYVFLADFYPSSLRSIDQSETFTGLTAQSREDGDLLQRCRWFWRGWTLQELIAPIDVKFYSSDWRIIGTRSSLQHELFLITGVDPFVLAGGDFRAVSVARRMSWASRRNTTRVEDMAYCLMGLFDVNMPLIYGEGEKAFTRLQEEIVKTTEDLSIFAWKEGTSWKDYGWIFQEGLTTRNRSRANSAFATSPADFERCGTMFPPLGLENTDDDDSASDALWNTASTTSSVTLVETTASGLTNSGLKQAVSFLLDDAELSSLFRKAVERRGVGLDRFRRILVGILRCLAIELAPEATHHNETASAIFIRRYRLLIASAVAADVAQHLKPVQIEASEFPHEEVDEEVEVIGRDELPAESDDEEDESDRPMRAVKELEAEPNFSSVYTFIRSSAAFQNMIKRLDDLAHPSFTSRATAFVDRLLKAQAPHGSGNEYWAGMKERMLVVISELSISPPRHVFVTDQHISSIPDRVKLAVESMTNEEWEWWPLQRPSPGSKPGEVKLHWTCFEKYCRNGYAHRGYGLPDQHRNHYKYALTTLAPPVSPEEFKHVFKHSANSYSWTTILPFHTRRNPDLPSDTVDRIPQRLWNFDKHSGNREDFWGLYVRERRSALMTALYVLLCLAPFIVFVVLYLLGVVQGDVQNATTPLAISLTCLSLLFSSTIKY
ncbi:heterokaryon incompatibility protein-domain-containing protein [Podospora didyma]|uniref:Heterokaryon incompatibility protein-domain-containing protein n=1 Tax=Podospora didyma TaxID=330526 RepID=A0AAE0NQ89_9PEZI|nr:heterokaryon incompatibility protein-domain-containing protein [Podospora didyma]